MKISDKLADELLRKVFPVFYFSIPNLDYDIPEEDLKKIKIKIKPEEFKKIPEKLSFTHFAILSWLRFKKENEKEITHSDLFKKIQKRVTTRSPYNKFQKKTGELRRLGFIKEKKAIGEFNIEITEAGVRALERAEDLRKGFLSEIIDFLGPERIEQGIPLYIEVIKRVDDEILV